MKAPPRERGDSFLLFHRLPYNYAVDLPLPLGPGIYLDETPHEPLHAAQPPALADYVIPGFHLPIGVNNCCLRSPVSAKRPAGFDPLVRFFNSIFSLRLRKPLIIEIAGGFELGDEGKDAIKNPWRTFEISSTWNWGMEQNERFSYEDILVAGEIAERLICIQEHPQEYRRLVTGITLFAQVTVGVSYSHQMCTLALFGALETLFAPKEARAKTLASRAADFLCAFDSDKTLEDWLEREYHRTRSDLIHGDLRVPPSVRGLSEIKLEAFGCLHEIARLSILGFISLPDDVLKAHSASKGKHLQNYLKALQPASGKFLESQRLYL